MKKETNYIISAVVILIIILVGFYFLGKADSGPGELDEFTACLESEDAIFWGAFWCPNCNDQKKLFGKSQKLLPYTECSSPDGNSQLQVCVDAGIEAYPTWEFADGSRLTGVVKLEDLAEKTGCELPTT